MQRLPNGKISPFVSAALPIVGGCVRRQGHEQSEPQHRAARERPRQAADSATVCLGVPGASRAVVYLLAALIRGLPKPGRIK
jgi:hypothetical protein